MSGLTNSILNMKSQIKSVDSVEKKIRDLERNMTGVNDDIVNTKEAVTKLSPEVSLIATDISALRTGISRMSRTVQVGGFPVPIYILLIQSRYTTIIFQTLSDPPRFSCGVTGDEVRVSGVIR